MFRKALRVAALVLATSLAAVGIQNFAGPAAAAIWSWSVTASSNATADASINWSEGQSPSSVNDSARAMMAVIAAWRNDIGAISATTGTSSAYVLTSNAGGFTAVTGKDGFLIGFIPNVTNAAGAITINVDGAGAKPLRSVTATNMNAGVLVAGSKYTAAYKFSTDEWLLFNSFPSQFEVPLGAMLPYTGTTAPNANFVIPAGQCISRTTYATYFVLVSTTFGACDGVTTFGVPDMRGRGVWGHDAIGGVAAGRINTAGCPLTAFNAIGEVCGVQSLNLVVGNVPPLTGTTSAVGAGNFLVGGGGVFSPAGGGATPVPVDAGSNFLTVTVNAAGGGTTVKPIPPMMGLNLILRVL